MASRAYCYANFMTQMEIIKALDKPAYEYLNVLAPSTWARHAFEYDVKSDHVTNNITESFNNWIGDIRDKPIHSMMDTIRSRIMNRLQIRSTQAMTWEGIVTPNIKKKLDAIVQRGRWCSIIFAGGEEYQVIDQGVQFVVNLARDSCTCRAWDVSGVPCKHVACAIGHKRGNIEMYCSWFFTKDAYMKAHQEWIHPVPDETFWPQVDHETLMLPPLRRMPGRPRKNRRREADEDGAGTSQSRRSSTVKCSTCNAFGHNKTTCQRAPVRSMRSKKQKAAAAAAASASANVVVAAVASVAAQGLNVGNAIGIGGRNHGTRGRGRSKNGGRSGGRGGTIATTRGGVGGRGGTIATTRGGVGDRGGKGRGDRGGRAKGGRTRGARGDRGRGGRATGAEIGSGGNVDVGAGVGAIIGGSADGTREYEGMSQPCLTQELGDQWA